MECKNCSAKIEDGAGYCSYCGARVLEDNITLRFLISEILDKVVSVDNRLLKTFLHLFSKPHRVIEDYIRGVRKRYFNPFNYLLISITLAGIAVLITREYTLGAMANNANSSGDPANIEFTKQLLEFIFDYQSFISIISIPFYAFVSWLVFLNRKTFNYLEHNIIYVYTSAHISVINFLLVGFCYVFGLEWYLEISLFNVGFFIVYNAYVLIRLFKLTFFQFVIKTLFFLLIGGFVYITMVLITVLIMFVFLGTDFFKQMVPKENKNGTPPTEQTIDSVPNLQNRDSIQKLKEQAIIDFYEANSKLNCLS